MSLNSQEDFQYYGHELLQMGRILVRTLSTQLRALNITILQAIGHFLFIERKHFINSRHLSSWNELLVS